MYSNHTITPETERSCHYFWHHARNFRLDENPPVMAPDIGTDSDDYCEYGFDDPAGGFCEVHDNGEIWSSALMPGGPMTSMRVATMPSGTGSS